MSNWQATLNFMSDNPYLTFFIIVALGWGVAAAIHGFG